MSRGGLLEKIRGNWKVGLACALIAFVLVTISLLGPWFTIGSSVSYPEGLVKDRLDLALTDSTYRPYLGSGIRYPAPYSDLPEDDPIAYAFAVTHIMMIFAFMLALLVLALAFLARKSMLGRKVALVPATLVVVLALAIVLYPAINLPGALEEEKERYDEDSFEVIHIDEAVSGFWGSNDSDFIGYPRYIAWGPGWAWYSMIAAFAFCLLGIVSFSRGKSKIADSKEPPETAPDGGFPSKPRRNWLYGTTALIAIIVVVILILAIVLQPPEPEPFEDTGQDIGATELLWSIDTGNDTYGAGDPIEHTIAFRVVPQALDPRADRIYVPSGNKLLALRPSTADVVWYIQENGTKTPAPYFEVSSKITADPIATNFGSIEDSRFAEFMVYVGTQDGTMYSLRESKDIDLNRKSPLPQGEDVFEVQANGSITSVAVYADEEPQINSIERVFFGTSKGWVYAYPALIDAASWSDEAWFYDFDSNEWRMTDEGERPYRRTGHSMVYNSEASDTYLFGGKTGEAGRELWMLEDTNWSRIDSPYPGIPVYDSALAFHEGANALLLFGGVSSSADVDQFLKFNLSNYDWEPVSATNTPPPMHGHEMIYSDRSYGMMLFGGYLMSESTWVFNWTSKTWSELIIQGPMARCGHSMVYDYANDRAILFGGWNAAGYFNDTWAFDFQSETWSQIAAYGPPPRSDHSMALSPFSNAVVLFGGRNETSVFDDTWVFDMSTDTWEKREPLNSPSGRFDHDMAFDLVYERTVLFGGDIGKPSELWKRKVGDGPIIMAGVPLMNRAYPRFSPAIHPWGSLEGKLLTYNDGGFLNCVWTENGTQVWNQEMQTYVLSDGTIRVGDNWSTAPIITEWAGAEVPPLVYFTTSNGFIHALYPEDAGEFESWVTIPPSVDNPDGRLNEENGIYGIDVRKSTILPDEGALTRPEPLGSYIYVASDSGTFYVLRRDRIRDLPAGGVRAKLDTWGIVETPIRYILGYNTIRFVDTTSRLYSVNPDGNTSYRVYIGTEVTGGISVWKDEQGSGHLHKSIWLGGRNGWVYCYSP